MKVEVVIEELFPMSIGKDAWVSARFEEMLAIVKNAEEETGNTYFVVKERNFDAYYFGVSKKALAQLRKNNKNAEFEIIY